MQENTPEFKSYKDRIVDFGIKAGSFPGDDGKTVNYKQLILMVDYDGDTEEIVLSGKTAPTPKIINGMLKGATKLGTQGNFLDDTNNG